MNPTYLHVMYGLAIAVAVIIPMMIYETCLDISAAKQVKNGRLAAARVRLIREVMLLLTMVALVVGAPSDIRRLILMSFVLLLALTEVYLRRAIRHSMVIPRSLVQVWELFFGPRE